MFFCRMALPPREWDMATVWNIPELNADLELGKKHRTESVIFRQAMSDYWRYTVLVPVWIRLLSRYFTTKS